MELFPAIDILGGQVVRLARGNYDAVTVYSPDPVACACALAEAGARWLHVVDLDGARTGLPVNAPLIKAIIAASGLMVEAGGGVRGPVALELLLEQGAARVVIGTQLVREPDFARWAAVQYGERIVAGIDADQGEVRIEGWLDGSGVRATELVSELASFGIRHLVYTDISKDGMKTGIDGETYRQIAEAAGFPVVASGGVASLTDLTQLRALGDAVIEGVIVGRALYDGAFTLAEALASLERGARDAD